MSMTKRFQIKFIFPLLSVFVQSSHAISCMACEVKNSTEECSLSYACPDGVEFCETLVSKIEGVYSIIFSCPSMDHCETVEGQENDGYYKCDHAEDNTECWKCCSKENCNTLPRALKRLPANIFESLAVVEIADDVATNATAEEIEEEANLDVLTKTIAKDEEMLDNQQDINAQADLNLSIDMGDEYLEVTTAAIDTNETLNTTMNVEMIGTMDETDDDSDDDDDVLGEHDSLTGNSVSLKGEI
ncbi:CLUMA_CG004791, isoform A [Clunio marinus]|uniref:CLUMA_CG004791, isoform A n=1 Tax=Clunio marinus TaxID=568069 RepID=A0A1J1HSR8_9DIPT|nr:CLUMA_CG004791, isoform A [Clunio marinus]